MSSVISVRLDNADFERLLALGNKRKVITKGIRLLFALQQIEITSKEEKIQEQNNLKEEIVDEN